MVVRVLTTTGLVLLALIGVACGGPVMELSTSDFDFGFIPEHYDVSYVMWMYSRGDTALVLNRLETDCPCIKSDFSGPQVLQPGDSLPVTVVFNSHRFIQRVTKNPTIHSNQGLGTQRIRVSAYVAVNPAENRPLTIKPYAVDASPIGGSQRDSVALYLTNVSDKPVHPSVYYLPIEIERLELPDVIRPGETARGEIILKSSELGTEFLKSFTIEVDDDARTHYTIPIRRHLGK